MWIDIGLHKWECDEISSCMLCRTIFAFWLDEEYIEPPKPEVDWSNVPVDTLVRVRDREDQEWTLRYFKGIDDGNAMCRYSVWASGATHIDTGKWSIDLPEDLEPLRKEIEKCINKNIPHGCCGGCI